MVTTQIYFSDFGVRTLKNGSYSNIWQDPNSVTVGIHKQGNGVDGYTWRAFLKYSLSSLPAKIIITNATLKIYCNWTNYTWSLPQGYRNLELHKVTSSWSFSTLSTEPTFQASALQTITGPLYEDTVYSFDITNTIKNIYANTEQNYGLMFKHQIDTWSATDISEIDFFSPLYVEDITKRPYIEITYTETVPQPPVPTAPIGLYKDSNNVIRFAWNVTGIQTKFNLYWSNNNGSSWHQISQTTSNTYYDMPANTLPTGQISWKVTIFNNYNEESADSTVNVFTATGVPQPPVITEITNTTTPTPTISWTSDSQQVYQVQIVENGSVIYDTGDMPSLTVKSHTILMLLDDGVYVAKVRVKNEFDLYSSWASAQFTITTPKPDKPPIILNQNKYSIDVISDLADNSYLLLYRADINSNDFKCVGKSTTESNIENFTIESEKQYQYKIRAVNNAGAFTDSDIKTITTSKFKMSIISPVSNLSNVFEVKYNLNDRPVKNMSISTPNSINYYSGRTYPIVEYSEHLSFSISLSFFINNIEDYQQLLEIFYKKGIVLYRDSRRKFYGNMSNISTSDHFAGYVINLSINQVDYNEYLEV